jgi:hypothetical protein
MLRNFDDQYNAIIVATAALSHAILEHAVADVSDPNANDIFVNSLRAYAEDFANFANKAELAYRFRVVKL